MIGTQDSHVGFSNASISCARKKVMSFFRAGSTLTTLFGSGENGGADRAVGSVSEVVAAQEVRREVVCREPLGLAAVVLKLAQQKAQHKLQVEEEENEQDEEEEPNEGKEPKEAEANPAPKGEKQTNLRHAWVPDTSLVFSGRGAASDRLPPHEPAVGYFRHCFRHCAGAPLGLVKYAVESAIEPARNDRLLPRHDPAVGYFRHNFAPASSAAGSVVPASSVAGSVVPASSVAGSGGVGKDKGGGGGTAGDGDSGLKLFFHQCRGSSSSNRKRKGEKK